MYGIRMDATPQARAATPSTTHPVGVAFLLTQLGAFAASEFSRRIAELGLTAPEAGLLRSVGRGPGRSQQRISDELDVHPSRLVAFVDDLERRGLLERRRDPTDRRRYAVYLTADGRELLDQLSEVARAHDDAVAGALTTDERTQLRALLRHLVEAHGLRAGVHPGYRDL
jgi:DNA-binding MarR family transcriptional regulator